MNSQHNGFIIPILQRIHKEDKMIKVNNTPSRKELVALIESNNRIIDLDPASIRSAYSEQVKFHGLEAFLSKFSTGKTFEIKNASTEKVWDYELPS